MEGRAGEGRGREREGRRGREEREREGKEEGGGKGRKDPLYLPPPPEKFPSYATGLSLQLH